MDRAARRRAERQLKDTQPLTMLVWSNMPGVGTGYGTQTEQVVSRFQADGHHVAVSVNYGLQGCAPNGTACPCIPWAWAATARMSWVPTLLTGSASIQMACHTF
jgi:hypothetical protein